MVSPALRQFILRRDKFQCHLCGATRKETKRIEVGHRIPKSQGGPEEPWNLQAECFVCNRGKSNRWDEGGSREARTHIKKLLDSVRVLKLLLVLLEPQEEMVLRMRFGIGESSRSLSGVAKEIGKSKEAVRREEKKALIKLLWFLQKLDLNWKNLRIPKRPEIGAANRGLQWRKKSK